MEPTNSKKNPKQTNEKDLPDNISDEILGVLKRQENFWTGQVQLAGFNREIPIIVQSDNHKPSIQDFDEALCSAKSLFQKLSSDYLKHIKGKISAELIKAVYSQGDSVSSSEESIQLQADMSLESIEFSPGVALLILKSTGFFPEQAIVAQINEDLDLDDLTVDEE